MGKYRQPSKPLSEDNIKTWILHDIRNELAESNRLKRLELDIIASQTGIPSVEELEDKV